LKGVSPVSPPGEGRSAAVPGTESQCPYPDTCPLPLCASSGPAADCKVFRPEAPGKALELALSGPEIRGGGGGSCLRNRLPGIQVRASLCCRKIPALPDQTEPADSRRRALPSRLHAPPYTSAIKRGVLRAPPRPPRIKKRCSSRPFAPLRVTSRINP
jgi:hypothetical protein